MARRSTAADGAARASAHHPQIIPSSAAIHRNTLMPGYRVRHDGWTQERTQRFLDALAHTGCVRDAARVAGISNVAGYRLKRRFPAFSDAWDDALARAQQGLIALAYKRAVEGRETVIIRKGEEVERRIAPSDAMLALLVKRGDMAGETLAEERLTLGEYRAGWRFDAAGRKVHTPGADQEATRLRVKLKLAEMRNRLVSHWLDESLCPACAAAFALQNEHAQESAPSDA